MTSRAKPVQKNVTTMTTTSQSTTHTEDLRHRIEELQLLLDMTVASIIFNTFTGAKQDEKAAALNRIADKI